MPHRSFKTVNLSQFTHPSIKMDRMASHWWINVGISKGGLWCVNFIRGVMQRVPKLSAPIFIHTCWYRITRVYQSQYAFITTRLAKYQYNLKQWLCMSKWRHYGMQCQLGGLHFNTPPVEKDPSPYTVQPLRTGSNALKLFTKYTE